jgi:hypothetical protein
LKKTAKKTIKKPRKKTKVVTLSELEKQALLQVRRTWIANHCMIEPKEGGLVPLEVNEAQSYLDAILDNIRRQLKEAGINRPVLIIILKARQEGISTYGLSYQYERINNIPNHKAMMAAHRTESSEQLFRKVQIFQEHNPQPRPTRYSNRREIVFADNGSWLWVATAGNDDLGRSGTMQDVHLSETAFWEHPEKAMKAVMQCVPDDPECTVIMESTANGRGGLFYQMWRAACPIDDRKEVLLCESTSNWVALFLPWHFFKAYRAKVNADFERTDYAHAQYGDEQQLVSDYAALGITLDDEQLQWRRNTITDKCNGDPETFQVEYPGTDDEAFLASGRPVFPVVKLRQMERTTTAPHEVGWLRQGTRRRQEEIYLEDNPKGPVRIWEHPILHYHYGLGGDTAEGRDPEESNDPDAHSAHLICVETRRVVAKIQGRFDPDEFGRQLDWLGRWYNDALLGVEVNNSSGGSTRSVLRELNYPNLYYREIWDKTANEPTQRLGWETNRATRNTMITDLLAAIRDGAIYVPDQQTLAQLMSFVWDKDGKPIAQKGEHDDDVISLCIAWQMVLNLHVESTGRLSDMAGETVDGQNLDEPPAFRSDMLIGGRESDMTEVIVAQMEWEVE